MPLRYRIFVSNEAVVYLTTLSSRNRGLLLQFFRELGSHPNQAGDYTEVDEAGRRIEVRVIDDFAILWWIDHAAAEIKITDVRNAG